MQSPTSAPRRRFRQVADYGLVSFKVPAVYYPMADLHTNSARVYVWEIIL